MRLRLAQASLPVGLAALTPLALAVAAPAVWLGLTRSDVERRHPAWRRAATAAVRVAHTYVFVGLALYPLVFARRYDPLFLAVYAGVVGHWLVLRNECVLSFLEARLVDPGYALGADPHFVDAAHGGTALVGAAMLTHALVAAFVAARWAASAAPGSRARVSRAAVGALLVALSAATILARQLLPRVFLGRPHQETRRRR